MEVYRMEAKRSRTVRALIAAVLVLAMGRAWADMQDQVQVTAVINRGDSWITVSAPPAGWNAFVIPGVLERVNSSVMTCEVFAANGPWDVTIYHTNGLTREALRGTGAFTSSWLPVKVWHASLGPTNFYAEGRLPHPMDDNVWTRFALGIRDRENSPSYFARQAWDMGSVVPFHFIIHAADAFNGATYRGRVFFELSIP